MARLIDDLLDVSRSTHGKLTLMRCRVDARGLVDAAVANCQPSIDARAQRLGILMPPGETTMHGDPLRLVQAISNLLDNASKFTPANGTITLRLFAREDEVSISVSDSGIGIAEDEFGDLFQSFAQSPRAARFRSGGLGVGLALVRDLVQAHGGEVSVHSAGENTGSEFTIRLPRQADGKLAREVEPALERMA